MNQGADRLSTGLLEIYTRFQGTLMTPHEAGMPDLPPDSSSSIAAHGPSRDILLPAKVVVSGADKGEQAETHPRSPEFTPALSFANLLAAVRYRWPRALAI